jgi:uncharacterized caspase-like protein
VLGLRLILLALASLLALSGSVLASTRIALVIGNSNYEHVARLSNPANDARAVADTLRSGGFNVVESQNDLRIGAMRRTLRDFADKARTADIAVIYYAGHGIEVEGSNYLIPVDAVLERDTDVYDEALSLDRILIAIEPAKQLRLVILDACRDNPFSKRMKHASTRSIGRGLAKIEPTSPNTLIAYAAKAGSTALDGDGGNSPFTTALIRHITTPGLDIRKAFGFIRDDVLKVTNNRQEPYVYGSLGGEDVSLLPAKPASTATAPKQSDSRADIRRDYELALELGTRDGWNAFLTQYPAGFYADLAKGQINKIDADTAQRVATENARRAQEERARLAQDGAQKAEQTKAAAVAKAAEEARLLADQKKQEAEAKVVVAEKERQSKEAQTSAPPPSSNLGQPAQASQQVASLPSTSETNSNPSKDVVRRIQAELRRVGCYSGTPEGDWDKTTRSAVQQFNHRSKSNFDTTRPSPQLVDGLQAHKDRVCSPSGKARRQAASPRPARHHAGGRCFVVGGQRYCE